jgi:hypothetical protein
MAGEPRHGGGTSIRFVLFSGGGGRFNVLADCPAMGTPDWQLLVADAWCSVRHPLLALEDRQHQLSRLIKMPAS